ncbi:MAG: hypothetical protein ACOYJR_04440 [Acutalibacteraceae bacterium]
MKKKNISRKIISVMMVLFLFMAFCSSALAYEFIFSFPSSDSNLPMTKYTTAKRTTSAPYVKHNANVTPTNYHLQYREGSSISVVYDPIASYKTIENYSTTVKKSFTYKTGYGGAGQYIYMVGVPTAATKGQKYYAYTSGGTWSP